MTNPGKVVFLPVLMLAVLTAGCHKNDSDQVNAAENGNLAPVSDTGGAAPVNESAGPGECPGQAGAPAPNYPAQSPQQPAGAATSARAARPVPAAAISGLNKTKAYSDQGYQDQVAEYAPEPPPPLPEYQQPPCPNQTTSGRPATGLMLLGRLLLGAWSVGLRSLCGGAMDSGILGL